MRLSEIKAAKLNAEPRPFPYAIVNLLDSKLSGFVLTRAGGALVGPVNVLLNFRQLGKPTWDYFKAIVNGVTLPKGVREVVILVTGTKLSFRYGLYAHEAMGAQKGLSSARTATIVAGERPGGLKADKALACDLASALLRGEPVAQTTDCAGVETFGEAGAAKLTFWSGAKLSFTLPATDLTSRSRISRARVLAKREYPGKDIHADGNICWFEAARPCPKRGYLQHRLPGNVVRVPICCATEAYYRPGQR